MLKVWFPGTNDTEDYGLGGTQWINDNVVIADDGKLGKCLSFNGSNSRLSTTNFELSNNWSFACWAKDDSSVTNWRLLIMLNTTGSDADTQMSFWLHTGEKRFEVCANGKYVSTVKYVPGQWNHFAATYDGSQILVYLNGVKVYTLANTNEQLARHNLTIGARGTNANGGHEGATSYFYGLVNDLRIWDNQVISPREIKELSKGLVLHYPLNRQGFGGDNILPNTWAGERTFEYPSSSYSDRWSCVTSIVPTASQYTLSFWAKSTVAGDQIRTHFYIPNTTTTCVSSQGITKQASDGNMTFTLSTEWEHYWVTYSQNETSAVKHVICPRMGAVGNTQGVCYGTGTVSIKGLKLEEGSVATPWVPSVQDDLYLKMGLNYGENLLKGSNASITSGYNTSAIKAQAVSAGSVVTASVQVDADNIVWDTTSSYHRLGFELAGIPKTDGTSGNQYVGAWAGQALNSGANVTQAFTGSLHGRVSKTFTLLGNIPDNHAVGLYAQGVSSGTLKISNPKLELGEHMTTWVPNTADASYSSYGLSGNIEYDVSGYGHNTTITNVSHSSDTPRYNVSTLFSKKTLGRFTTLFSPTHLTSEMTLSCWIKRGYTSTTPSDKIIFEGLVRLYIVYVSPDYKLRLTWNHGTSSSSYSGNTSDMGIKVPLNEWHHYVWTFKDGYLKTYVDGQYNYYSDRTNTGQFIVGYRGTRIGYDNDASFEGGVSDLRLYMTCLSDNDILELYHTPITLANNGVLMTQGEFEES